MVLPVKGTDRCSLNVWFFFHLFDSLHEGNHIIFSDMWQCSGIDSLKWSSLPVTFGHFRWIGYLGTTAIRSPFKTSMTSDNNRPWFWTDWYWSCHFKYISWIPFCLWTFAVDIFIFLFQGSADSPLANLERNADSKQLNWGVRQTLDETVIIDIDDFYKGYQTDYYYLASSSSKTRLSWNCVNGFVPINELIEISK